MNSKRLFGRPTRYFLSFLAAFFLLMTVGVILIDGPAYSEEQVYKGDSKDDPQDESADYGE